MRIAEVSRRYGLSVDTLRYYERVGLIPSVGRNPSGLRDYTEEDCRWVEFVKCMRGAGLPIDTLIEYVALFHQGHASIDERKALLIRQRQILIERMAEMQGILDRLNGKIERYEQAIIPMERGLI
jgi:DNA-binding transcriptional MerR regulator